MKFKFVVTVNGFVELWYTSSKESFRLARLNFIDMDGDERLDVKELLLVTVKRDHNPMMVVEETGR